MTIFCAECHFRHEIVPLSAEEDTLMRAFLLNQTHKTYFCDLLCYLRRKNPYHPDGYKADTKVQIQYLNALQNQPHHAHWKPIPWLKDAAKKADSPTCPHTITLEHEESIVQKAMEKAKRDAERQREFEQYRGYELTNEPHFFDTEEEHVSHHHQEIQL